MLERNSSSASGGENFFKTPGLIIEELSAALFLGIKREPDNEIKDDEDEDRKSKKVKTGSGRKRQRLTHFTPTSESRNSLLQMGLAFCHARPSSQLCQFLNVGNPPR